MKAFLLTTITILLGLSTLSGQVTLRNTLTGKTKTLKSEGQIGLGMPIEGQGLDCGYRMLNGYLMDVQKKVVRVLPHEEKKSMTFDNGLVKKETTKYENLNGLRPASYAIADISHLTYRNKRAENWNSLGGFITTLSALSTLAIAPLVSIDYGEGEFNSDRYFRWAGYSLGATGVGIGLLLGSKKRHFDIQRPGQPPAKNFGP